MAVRRKNVYEKQAILSVILAAAGSLCLLAALLVIFFPGKFDFEGFQRPYSPKGLSIVAILGALAGGVATGGAGLLLGFLSAGQRTNKRNNLSWTGFFLNAGVVALVLSCGAFFYFIRLKIS